ncbi:tail fiber protein [Bacillus phage YungSlug]|nr:tail fiber protein [Bacillus phage YungSlug]
MATIKIRIGGKWIEVAGGAGGSIDPGEILDEANKYADELRKALEKEINDLNTSLENTSDYIDNAFKDGIITEMEARKIKTYLNILATEKTQFDQKYVEILSNVFLPGERKTALMTAKNDYDTKYNYLVKTILDSIDDGVATPEESTAVDEAFKGYRNAIALLVSLLELAINDIGSEKSKEAKDHADNIFANLQTHVESEFKKTKELIELRVTEETYVEGLNKVISDANKYTDEQKLELNQDLTHLQESVQDTKDYIETAFKDGIIYDAEKRKIEGYLNTLAMSKADFDKRYEIVYSNASLVGTPKTNLATAKTTYDTKYKTLVDTIVEAIKDQIATEVESIDVNNKFKAYNDSLSLLSSALEVAIDAIGKEKARVAEENAKKYADELKKGLDDDLGKLNQSIKDTDKYIDTAFKDGIVTEVEAKKIQSYLNGLAESKATYDSRVTELLANGFLDGVEKIDLTAKKSDYDRYYNALVKTITDAIADGKSTPAEASDVDLKFFDYNNSVKAIAKSIEKAIDKISKNKANNAEKSAKDYADGIVAPIEERVEVNEGKITTMSTEIGLRVTKEVYDTGMKAVNDDLKDKETRLYKAEGDIRVQAENITQRVRIEEYEHDTALANWYNQVKASSPNIIGDLENITPPAPYEWVLSTLPDGTKGRVLRKTHVGGSAKNDTGWIMPSIPVNPKKTYLLEFYVMAMDNNGQYYWGREETKEDGTNNDQGNGPYVVGSRRATDSEVGKWVKWYGLIPPHDAGTENSHTTVQSDYTPGEEFKFWNKDSVKIQPKVYLAYNPADVSKNSEMYAWGFGLYEVGSVGNLYQSTKQAQASADAAKSAADKAQGDAVKAQESANTLKKLMDDVSADNKLSPGEKTDTKYQWEMIVAEKPTIVTQANTYSVTTELTEYTKSYDNLNAYITPLIADLSTTSDIDGAVYRQKFSDYTTKRTVLLKKITDLAKGLADKAQAEAESAKNLANGANGKIDNLSLGGRNLLLDTQGWSQSWVNQAPTGYAQKYFSLSPLALVLIRGKEVTLSFKLEGKVTAFGSTNKWIGIELKVDFTDGTIGYYSSRVENSMKLNTDYFASIQSTTVTVPDKSIKSMTAYMLARDFTGTVKMYEPKIEVGNRASDWSPAPEDFDKKVDNQLSSAVNLFRNSGNFKSLNGWILNGGKSLNIVKKDGFSVLEAVGSITCNNLITNTVLKPATKYVYTMELMFSKDTPIDKTTPMHWWFSDAGANQGAVNNWTIISPDTVAKANTWTRISLLFETKPTLTSAVFFKAFVYGPTVLTDDNKYWLKNVMFSETERIVTWAPSTQDLVDMIASSANGLNLLDGTALDDLSVWNYNPSFAQVETGIMPNGVKNMKVDVSGAGSYSDWMQKVPVEPNSEYTLSLNAGGSIQTFLWEKKADGTPTAVYTENKLTTSGAWDMSEPRSKFTTTINTQPDTKFLQVIFRVQAGGTGNTGGRFALAKLEKGSVATDWSPSMNDIRNMVGLVNVGGRNILNNSETLLTSWGSDQPNDVERTYQSDSSGKYVQAKILNAGKTAYNLYTWLEGFWSKKPEQGKEYTISCDAYATVDGCALKVREEVKSRYFETPIPNGVWKRITLTFRYDWTFNRMLLIGTIPSTAPAGTLVKLKNFKLEEGNKATDYTMSPEDLNGLINAVDTKAETSKKAISDMSSDSRLTPVEKVQLKKEWATMVAEKPQYETLSNSFGIGAEKTAYVTAYNTLNTVLNTTPGYLKNMQTTDDINGTTFRAQFDDYYDRKAQLIKKINETIQGNVNNISVGGRNLLLGTSVPVTTVGTGTTNQTFTPYYFAKNSQPIINAPNCVMSFDWVVEGTPSGTMYVQGNNPYPNLADTITFSATNKSGRSVSVRNITGTPFTGVNFRLDNFPVGSKVTVSNVKMEIGNKATDWTPAPEDVDGKIDGINVGGRNLLLNSDQRFVKPDYLINQYTLSEDFITGQEYTFVIKGTVPAGQQFGIWMNGGSTNVGYATTKYANGVTYVTFTAVATTAGNQRKLNLYNYPSNTTSSTTEWVALYKGNKPMDWSPAPEDIAQKFIDGVIYAKGTGANHGGNRILQVNGNTIYDTTGRGLRLTVLKRSDLSVVFDQTYDTYSGTNDPNQIALASKITSYDANYLQILTSYDAHTVSRQELKDAFESIGGTGKQIIGTDTGGGRAPFAFLGFKGLGVGGAIEVMTSADKTMGTVAEIYTKVVGGTPQGISTVNGEMGNRVKTAEATIINQGTQISQKVSTEDFNGNKIASLINQTATTILIKASQIQLQGFVTFDMIQGGTIRLGGANNVNGRMEIFDKNGESVGLISAEDGGFSRLSVDFLTAQNVLQMTSQNHPNYVNGYLELWVDGENGSNNATGRFGDPVRSIQEAINRLPKYLMHNVQIKIVPTFYSESLDIAGFKGIGGIYLNSAHYNVRYMRLSTTGTITSNGTQGPTSLYVRTLAGYDANGEIRPTGATSTHPAFTPERGPQAAIDNNWDTYTDLYGGADGERRYLTADLGKVYERLTGVTFWLSDHGGQASTHKNVLLEVSTDGKVWRKIKEYPTWKAGVPGLYDRFTMTGKVTIRQSDDVVIDRMFNDFSYNNSGGAIVEVYSSKLIMRQCVMNGGPNNDNCIFAHHSDFELNGSELNKSKSQLVSCNYGTVATLTDNIGGDANYAYFAGTASHVSGWGSVPWGNSGYGQSTGGGILNGEWSNDNRKKGSFTSAPPPPPPPQYQTMTRQWQSYHCDSFGYFLGSSRWKPDEDVPLQGKWGDYGQWKGCWFFPDDMWDTIYASNVTEVQSVRVWVGRINGAGNAGDTPIYVRTHPHQYKPGGDPSMSGGYDIINLSRGVGGWVSLSGNNMDNFRTNSKWARGIAVYAGSDNSYYYAKMQNECYVEVTYKVKI